MDKNFQFSPLLKSTMYFLLSHIGDIGHSQLHSILTFVRRTMLQ